MRKGQNGKQKFSDGFSSVYEFWCTRILNWSKWILVVDIPTQISLTVLLSIDNSLRGVEWVYGLFLFPLVLGKM